MQACRVVLVRTEVPGNIGATARVMRNFGLDDLVLVAPVADRLDAQARAMATHHAVEVLERARVIPDLASALADCVLAAATSALTGGLYRRQTVGPPEVVAAALALAMPSGKVALVFGPEPHGLTNEEVARCHFLMHIPANEEYSALNLAQAVAIGVYEVHKAWRLGGAASRPSEPEAPARPSFQARSASEGFRKTEGLAGASGSDGLRQRRPGSNEGEPAEVAPYEEQERMFARLQQALTEVRYLRGLRGEVLMFALRGLIARARPSPMEVRLLHGLARQLLWVAERAELGEGPPEEDP
jgi:tRNA/rRNA methyltransferase